MSSKQELTRFEDDFSGNDFDADELPPTYSSLFTEAPLTSPTFSNNQNQHTLAALEDSGRFSIDLSAGSRTSVIFQGFSIPAQRPHMIDIVTTPKSKPEVEDNRDHMETPPATNVIGLDIVLMLVGSRDDVKSCISIGQGLCRHGHRVRVATHSIFSTLVRKAGLEFFSVSSDPDHPMAKLDSGLMPGLISPKKSEAMKNSKILIDSLKSCWIACTHPGLWKDKPFLADAIVATPLAHAHLHCAERLSIPLHIMSTTPWTPTRQFAHPLAHVQADSEMDRETQNYLSYLLIEESLLHEVYHVIDHFRQAVLGLQRLPVGGGSLLRQLNIPHTYLCSSALIQRPTDWEDMIDLSGYILLEGQSSYTPSEELVRFLESTPAPIFVSLDVTLLGNLENFVRCLKEASNKYGLAFLLPSGFRLVSGLSGALNIFVLENVPIEWLMPKVSVLFTHGDTATISMGLRHGKPMVSLPLLRDQPFWSSVIHNACIGPAPIQEKDFSTEPFVDAVRHCLRPEVREAVQHIGEQIRLENGVESAVNSFHRHFNCDELQCSITKADPAVYRLREKPTIKLSTVAAAVLMRSKAIRRSELELIKREPQSTESEQEVVVIEKAGSSLVKVKSVSKSLIKATVKPTISHISDACSWREAQVDSDTKTENRKIELSKADMAVKVAKTVGFGSAVFCGKIAALPFKTVWYMGETASYGIRSLKGADHHDKGLATMDQQYEATALQEHTLESKSGSEHSMQKASSDNQVDQRLVEMIGMLQRKRGTEDKRFMDPDFGRMIVSEFEVLCRPSWK